MAKLAKAFSLLVTTLLVQLGGGKDVYWVHNTNWDNPSNWALGRVPCGGDNVMLPNDAVTFLNEDVTVGSIILPENGLLLLEPSITIRFADNSECEVPTNTEPMAADIKENRFLAPKRYWECADNWLVEDREPPDHPPCGEDNAIFKMGSSFSVAANESITVRSITVRGSKITSLKDELDQKEFNLDVKVEPECGKRPVLCPCPSDAGCPKVIPTNPPTTQNAIGHSTNSLVPQNAIGRSNTVGIAVGVVVLVIVAIVVIVAFTITIVVVCRKHKRTGGYAKDELLEDPLGHGIETGDFTHEGGSNPKGSNKSSSFDNPVYGSHNLNDDEVQMIGYETKLSDGDEQSFKPSLDEYQLPGETHEPQLDYNIDAGDVNQDEEKMPQYKYGKL